MARKQIRDKDGKWLDSQVFREEGLKFLTLGYYTEHRSGTPEWYSYWKEQLERCINGYKVLNQKITGHHYMYLNFTQIEVVEKTEGSKAAKKVSRQPDFWDGDYDYFWCVDIAQYGLFNKNSKVETTAKEKLDFRKAQDIIDILIEEETPNITRNPEYIRAKRERDKVSAKVLGRLKMRVKPHEDYLDGGNHMIVGKDQPITSIVKTPEGDKCIGDLKPNDIVYNPHGTMSRVVANTPQGHNDVYEVELFDGRKTRCGYEHLWEVFGPVYRKNKRTEKVLELKEILSKPLKVGNKYKNFLRIAKPIEKLEKYLKIPPYTLGALLGDGNVTKQLKLSGKDDEILENVLTELNMFFKEGQYVVSSRHDYNWSLVYRYGGKRYNPIYEALQEMNLNCKSAHKYIPTEYKEASIAQRLELVKGMMDTDGTVSTDGAMSFGNVSKQLVLDLQEVLYSLGIQSTYRIRKDGLHIIYINTNVNIFGIKRKKDRVRSDRKSRKFVAITKITKLDVMEETTCIQVEGPSNLYLTDGYIPTHNSRRKGYSFKNGAVCANIYNTVRKAQVIVGAFDTKYLYPTGTMGMASNYLNFLNTHTAWTKSRDYTDKVNHRKATYKSYASGASSEEGYFSEIFAVSFFNNPDAIRGKDGKLVLFEEAGAFPNLKDSYNATKPALTAGKYTTGMMIIFGTGGDMTSGTVDYADMFYNPETYSLMPFYNIWDDNAEQSTCGFFHPVEWNMEGYYDEQGNSDVIGAAAYERRRRKKILENSSSTTALDQHTQEFPFCPAEAFLTVNTNNFPVVELRQQLTRVLQNNLQFIKGTPVKLYREDGEIKASPDINRELQPIINYNPKVSDPRGCPIIYEFPVENAPKGLYKIGYDPYRQDLSSGVSLASVYVYKTSCQGSYSKDIIAAEYVGRPPEADDVNRIASQLAELYNAEIMHENEVTHVKNYFRRHLLLRQLAVQPDAVISKNIKHSTVARVYGCHMNVQLKDAGEKYIKDWLLGIAEFNEHGEPVLNLERIYSIGLLEELIQYNSKNNFDRVSALIMCMMQVQEDVLGKEYVANKLNSKTEALIKLMKKSNSRYEL